MGAIVVLRNIRAPLGYVVQENGCWEWFGGIKGNGYGVVWYDGGLHQAHRWVYEQFCGPIPEGLQLDHLCRNRRCVRPEHLEPVTRLENLRRGVGNAGKRQCKRGHAFDAENTRHMPNGSRQCKTCIRAKDRIRTWLKAKTHRKGHHAVPQM